jgi:Protein NO VEIN, C-terminal
VSDFVWKGDDGLPSEHVLEAAVHVATLLDDPSSAAADARESYWRKALGGSFGPSDLRLGERLLVDIGLVIETDERLSASAELRGLLEGSFEGMARVVAGRALELTPPAAESGSFEESLSKLVPNAERREELLAALRRRFDDGRRRAVGAVGEQLVVDTVREELRGLGYPDLAREVRQLSLESDQAGYDISAPLIGGPKRLLEVKATTAEDQDRVSLYLSRNEADTGLRYESQWALVLCRVLDVEEKRGELLGWLSVGSLRNHFPLDTSRGRWANIELEINVAELYPGVPGATG